jgi:hypothetical protein
VSGMTGARYDVAPTFEDALAAADANRDLWHGLYARTELPEWARERVVGLTRPVRLLALSADWCGDAVNILPWIARLTEASPHLELRVLDRDENLDLMDAHLTNGARSIPVVIAYEADFTELGWWGPRPAELQRWVVSDEGRALESAARYAQIRRWYARDRGVAILSEVLDLLAR